MDSTAENEFYDKLKVRLLETSTWPAVYLYKFIVPTAGTGVKEIESVFDDTNAVIIKKLSKNEKYTSLSISLQMENPDAVIEKYVIATKVAGVISL
ncbi:MAG: DUF493 domain-containing protein [Cellulophaga sp.]|nr:DUF493 domain-containing protein [Cellulophaga sp.]